MIAKKQQSLHIETEFGYVRPSDAWTELTRGMGRSHQEVAHLGEIAAITVVTHNTVNEAFHSTIIDFGHHAEPPIDGADLDRFEKAAIKARHLYAKETAERRAVA